MMYIWMFSLNPPRRRYTSISIADVLRFGSSGKPILQSLGYSEDIFL